MESAVANHGEGDCRVGGFACRIETCRSADCTDCESCEHSGSRRFNSARIEYSRRFNSTGTEYSRGSRFGREDRSARAGGCAEINPAVADNQICRRVCASVAGADELLSCRPGP